MRIFKKALSGISRIFGVSGKRDEAAAAASRRQSTPGPPLHEDLGRMVEVKSPVAAGTVYWVGLREFRERFGNRWHAVAPVIDGIARKCIEARLGNPKDSYGKHGDDFAIVFASLSKEEARLQCALIAKDITDQLLGVQDLPETISLGSVAVGIDRETAKNIASADALGTLLKEEAQRQKARRAQPVSASEALADIRFMFQSMWNARHHVVSSYRCVPARVTDDGQLLVGRRLIPAWNHKHNLPASAVTPLLDLYTLRKINGILDVRQLLELPDAFIVPVHFSTLRSKGLLGEYLKALNAIPPDLRQMMLIEIVGVDDKGKFVGLSERVLVLKPKCRTVLLAQPLDQTDFQGLQYSGVGAVGVDLENVADPERDIVAKLRKFVSGAREYRLATYAYGVPTFSLAEAALAAGVHYLSQPKMIPETEITLPSYSGNPSGGDVPVAVARSPASFPGQFDGLSQPKAAFRPDPAPRPEPRPEPLPELEFVDPAEPEPQRLPEQASVPPSEPVSDPVAGLADQFMALTKKLIEENGLSEADAKFLARAKLGLVNDPAI